MELAQDHEIHQGIDAEGLRYISKQGCSRIKRCIKELIAV
jgi:hypothetical protein